MRNGYLTRNFLEPIPDSLKIHVQNQRSIGCKTNSVHHMISQSTEIIYLNDVAYNWYYLRFLLLRNTAESENADFRSLEVNVWSFGERFHGVTYLTRYFDKIYTNVDRQLRISVWSIYKKIQGNSFMAPEKYESESFRLKRIYPAEGLRAEIAKWLQPQAITYLKSACSMSACFKRYSY